MCHIDADSDDDKGSDDQKSNPTIIKSNLPYAKGDDDKEKSSQTQR